MIDVNKLKGVMAERGISQVEMAKTIGITPKTFYSKMSKGIFNSNEIEIMIDTLSLNNPCAIFFVKNVT